MKRILSLIFIMLAGIHLAFAAVNLNSATPAELQAVKGIGPTKAKRIVAYRSEHGPFKSVDDLEAVKGFGAKSVARLRGELSVSGPAGTAPAARTAKK